MAEDLIEPRSEDAAKKSRNKKKRVSRVVQLHPILYTRDDAAAALGISTSSFDRYVAPTVPRHYVGGSLVLYSPGDLIKFAETRRTELPPL